MKRKSSQSTNKRLVLPKWTKCYAAYIQNKATPLEAFIYLYEPVGFPTKWRRKLVKAINDAQRNP